MDLILADLGKLLLRAVPTFLLVLVLHFYLKRIFFHPLDRVLEARREATKGARHAAEASLEQATQRSAEYEAAVRAAMERDPGSGNGVDVLLVPNGRWHGEAN